MPSHLCAPIPSAHQGVDEHTLALWLFDDPPYANVILTDAGPYQADLRLETGFKKPLPTTMHDGTHGLVAGRFGRALCLPVGEGASVVWATNPRIYLGAPPMLDRGDEVPERFNLGYLDFTIEFWFCASGEQCQRGVIWELRNDCPAESAPSFPRGVNALCIDAARAQFILVSRTLAFASWDLELAIPSDAAALNDGAWHHLAFTFTTAERQMRHYVDGHLQLLPGPGTFLPLMGQLTSMRLGSDAEGQQELRGALDELRLSDVVRYGGDYALPGSLARAGSRPWPASRPDGPPLLFAPGAPEGPLPLGNRKHVFIDDALLDRTANLALVAQPPMRREVTDFRCTRPWEPGPRMGPAIPDICSFWQDGGDVRMLYSNNGLMGGKATAVCLATSADGLHWTKPNLGRVPWDGQTDNNIVLRNACQGTVFADPNPAAPPDQRYKFVAWCMQRGFYVFTSPDGERWQRNECLALPFDPDGSIEVFWDEQCGLYRGFSRALLGPANYRAIVRSQTADIMQPWPFTPSPTPEWHVFAAPKPTQGELPLVETYGEVYRFKGIKYPWAPDAYLAFPWRYIRGSNIRPGSFLMVSRDAERWSRYEPPYYLASGWELEGRTVREALMEQGMVRRGDELWQYGTVRFTEHAGALYRGMEHEGGYFDRLLRLTQRLDGFVALEAGPGVSGSAVTKPFTFAGRALQLNLTAAGSARVGLLDERGQPIAGWGVDDCLPFRGDALRHTVRWQSGTEVGIHARQPIRLQLDLVDAKVFAFQFVSGVAGPA